MAIPTILIIKVAGAISQEANRRGDISKMDAWNLEAGKHVFAREAKEITQFTDTKGFRIPLNFGTTKLSHLS